MKHPSDGADPVLRTAVIVIAVATVFVVLKLGEDIFAPMVLATVAGVMLAPVTDGLVRLGIARGLAAALILLAGMVLVAIIVILVEPVFWRVAGELPRIKFELRTIIDEVRGLIRGLDAVNKEVEEALGTRSNGESDNDEAPVVPNLTNALLFAPVFLAQMFIFLGTLFFFLFTRTGIYGWMSRRTRSATDTHALILRFTMAERLVARYFLTISIINTGLGVAVGAAMLAIGLPGPLIWGLAAAILNFILYVGPMSIAAGLFFAGLVAFDGFMVMAPPVIYLFLNMMEAQFVTPALVGKHIAVNPLLIFVSLVFWLWLWGPIGAFIAIPVLAIALVMLDVFDVPPESEMEAIPDAPLDIPSGH